MLAKYLLWAGVLTLSHAADILTFQIMDFQGSTLALTSPGPNSLVPVESIKNAGNIAMIMQWDFIYAARGNPNEYRVVNRYGPSILSYTTANITSPSLSALHAQVVGNQNVDTFWILVFLDKNGTISFIEEASGLAMTAWPAGKRSRKARHSPLTLEEYDKSNAHQVFKLMNPSA
ncbi:hypothetical protein B0H12DRAFT_1232308 [Mycena haematopus]|nr:hypothetical protein B0H12DRAFT_1232308 [Mycena haematopus]